MRTRSQARKRRQQQVRQTSVEPPNLEKPNNNQELFNPPIVTMADNRTMAQLLEAPTEGYEDAIVVPEITANNFEIKHGLLNLVQNKQFFGHDKEDPHAHIRYFNKITSTMKFPNVPSTSVKLMLFPFSLEGAARIWLEKEPPRSILTWDDLVSKFINKFFPPSKTTNLRNEITRFQQKFDETFYEAWDRFNDLLRGCPHHGFSELHQLDTFYNALNSNDQDSLNSAAGGNFLDKMPRECLKIIESKSKVRQSRSKAIVSKVSTSSSTPAVSSDVAELKDMVRALILDKKNQTPAPVKAVEQSCVTCGGGHSYQNCPATDGNIYRDNIQEYVSQAAAANFNQGNTSYRPQMVANQIRPPGFPPVQSHQGNNQNNFNRGNNYNQNRGNNFNQSQVYRPQVNQPPAYQAPVPQTHGVSKTDFDNYVKANDAILRNMQNQCQTLQNKMANLTDMLSKFVTSNTASTSGSGTLSGNTVTNPKEDLKVLQRTRAVPTNNIITEDVQPPVIQVQSQNPTSEPDVDPVSAPMPNQRTSIPFPSRRNDERRREKANDQIEKFYEIFRDLSFEISFTDALTLMPKFASTLKTLIGNKEKLSEMARTPLNENSSENLSLPELTPTCMTLELADRSITEPIGIAKDVRLMVGKFQFPADFVVVDFEPDPRVPLILGRSFLKTSRALIDVYEGFSDSLHTVIFSEIQSNCFKIFTNTNTFGDSDFSPSEEANAFIANKTSKFTEINATYYDPEGDICPQKHFSIVNRCLLFRIIKIIHPNREELKVVEAKTVKSSMIELPEILIDPKDQEKTTFTCPYGTFAYRRMPFGLCNAPGTFQRCMMAIFHDMIEKTMEVFMDDFSVFGDSFSTCLSHLEKMLKRCEDTNLSLNWEKSHFMVKEGIVLGHKISKSGIEVDRAKVEVIAKLPHPTTVKGVRSFLGHAGFYRRFIQDFSKIARPMTHLLEKETPFFFSEECIESFNTLKRKLTEAPILIAPDWDLPFELMLTLALADLGASINLMPLSIWKELSLPALTKTRMILELADRTISTPTGIAEDVFVKVGTFFFPADFVVVDYVSNPRAPLILGRPFLRMARALIDVHGEQMTLRHDDQSVTFKVGDTKTFSYNIIESVNRVDVIDIACEEYVQEVLEISESGNPTSTSDLMIDSRSPSFTPFGGSDFLMEEIDEFLEHDDSIPPGVDGIYDSEGDTIYLEELLSVINSDPNLPPSPVCEINVPEEIKSSCEDPSDLELKDYHPILIPRLVTGWRVCIDYRKLIDATRKDHFPLPFMDQMLERLAENEYSCFLDGFSGYFQIPIDPLDQEKTTFTC
ncbi:reverse transcriptase domain-containing protein, partial [Tanacetum coccineum]